MINNLDISKPFGIAKEFIHFIERFFVKLVILFGLNLYTYSQYIHTSPLLFLPESNVSIILYIEYSTKK